MSDYKLLPCHDAAAVIAPIFQAGRCVVEVLEDKAFAGAQYLSLGEISLESSTVAVGPVIESIQRGAYEWTIPAEHEVRQDLLRLLDLQELGSDQKQSAKDQYERGVNRVERTLDSIATVGARLGLLHPLFDPISVEQMPSPRAGTVIVDTSGVLQGGLDFVSRFLHPALRIKVPAVVQMEITNLSDNFFKRRRAAKVNKSALLLDHVLSQSGQRVLLRLELGADIEIERTPLLGDPLRNAFQRGRDDEWADLQISVPLRSYCDRLILEAASLHQAHSSPGHSVSLLTSDQGLARMALSEGISPLYFQTLSASAFFGQHLTGAAFHPLNADIVRVPLQAVLWELATAFGAARLTSGHSHFEVAAIDENLSWSPIHSRNDLLWVRQVGVSGSRAVAKSPRKQRRGAVIAAPPSKGPGQGSDLSRESRRYAAASAGGYYRFNVERMFRLVEAMRDGGGAISHALAAQRAGTARPDEYKRFLLAGEYATIERDNWVLTDAGLSLGTAIVHADREQLSRELARVPSFKAFLDQLADSPARRPVSLRLPERADTTYRVLGEVAGVGAPIVEKGYFATLATPSLPDFVRVALERFHELDTGDGYVSVGAWLECLIECDGVHPLTAREALEEASAAGMIQRMTEGSTTDTRHDRHSIHILRNDTSGPSVEIVHLYRGDFLIPGKSSSSMRLAGEPV